FHGQIPVDTLDRDVPTVAGGRGCLSGVRRLKSVDGAETRLRLRLRAVLGADLALLTPRRSAHDPETCEHEAQAMKRHHRPSSLSRLDLPTRPVFNRS